MNAKSLVILDIDISNTVIHLDGCFYDSTKNVTVCFLYFGFNAVCEFQSTSITSDFFPWQLFPGMFRSIAGQ